MAETRAVLRVCADPNNLPFSNEAGEGFENRLAQLVAKDLGVSLHYTWWAERKSFLKNSLDANLCDVVMGVPAMMDPERTTQPYYSSTYVFLTRADRNLKIASLTDPHLGDLRIGMHVVDDDYAPPAHLLARFGLSAHLVGYSLYGAHSEENPPSKLIDAVARGDVDVAIVWGPFAGYFAKRAAVPLTVTPVSPAMFLAVPFTYGIGAAVRKNDTTLRAAIQNVLMRECKSIGHLLNDYGVPLTPGGEPACDTSHPAAY